MKNSCARGKRGERQWRDELRAHGYAAHRGRQYSGSPDSPDVVCEGLPHFHFEVKLVERLNLFDAMAQARRDAGGKVPLVAHRRNFWPWLVTMDAVACYRLLRQDCSGAWAATQAETSTPLVALREVAWVYCLDLTGTELTLHEAVAQAGRAVAKPAAGAAVATKALALVAHRDRVGRWLLTMASETFFQLLRGDPAKAPTPRNGAAATF